VIFIYLFESTCLLIGSLFPCVVGFTPQLVVCINQSFLFLVFTIWFWFHGFSNYPLQTNDYK